MTPDTYLTLGEITFSRVEIPERIGFGGEQTIAVHRLVGGSKTADAMGWFPAPLVWNGRFRGESALDRSLYLKGVAAAGAVVQVAWSRFAYLVIIRRFLPVFERIYEIPYQIECEVVQDLTQPVTSLNNQSPDDLISADMDTSSGLLGMIGNASLTSSFASVQSAIAGVSNFATAAQSQLNSVLQPIQQFRGQVQTLLAQTNNVLINVTTVGGILPNNPISQNVARLTNQIVASQQIPLLINLDRTVGRVGSNIGSLYSSAKQVTVGGGDLMTMASKEYGDPMAWTGIAKANGLTDPQLTGINTITVPPTADTAGGVLVA